MLRTRSLLDITLAAEGKYLKAHKIILAASSTYFEDLLSDPQDQQPMIFFRDVRFTELEVLVKFIYTGVVDIPGSSLDSFLSLAKSLGVTGFLNSSENEDLKSPAKRKLLLSESVLKETEHNKENVEPVKNSDKNNPLPLTPNKISEKESHDLSVNKKRRTLVEDSNPQYLKIPSQSLSTNCPAYPTLHTTEPIYTNLDYNQHQSPAIKEKAGHGQLNSKVCRDPNEPHKPSLTTKNSNFSFDCHFPPPEELEAQGATLLHHLAVWMIQQQRDDTGHTVVKDELPAPAVDNDNDTEHCVDEDNNTKHRHSRSLPTNKHTFQANSLTNTKNSSHKVSPDCERPDSGFESKDEPDDERNLKDEGSSPEIREISRQAASRQPILKKKKVMQHRF